MEIKLDDVTEKLTSLGYTVKDDDTVIIKLITDEVVQHIKNYCHITDVPSELYFVAVDMVAGKLLKARFATGGTVCDGVDFSLDGIKSITEGDTSVTYNSDSDTSSTARYTALINALCDRDDELMEFRRLRW